MDDQSRYHLHVWIIFSAIDAVSQIMILYTLYISWLRFIVTIPNTTLILVLPKRGSTGDFGIFNNLKITFKRVNRISDKRRIFKKKRPEVLSAIHIWFSWGKLSLLLYIYNPAFFLSLLSRNSNTNTNIFGCFV